MRWTRRAWVRALAAAGAGGLAGCADGGTGTADESPASATTAATTPAATTGTPSETDAPTATDAETEPTETAESGLLGEPDEETERAVIYRDVPFRDTTDGTLALDYYRPTGADEPVPLVVHVHGGGWAVGSKGGGRYADVPVEEGAAFASLQYRLSGTTSFPHPVRDVVAGVAWCREHAGDLGVDPERVALTGESAGGHLASLVATAPGEETLRPEGVSAAATRVDCVVSVSGVYEFRDVPMGDAALVRQFLGCDADAACDDEQASASPAAYVDGDDPPALLYHGTADSVVPYSQAETFVAGAEDAGMSVSLVTGDGGGHVDPYAGEWGDRYEKRQREFLQEHLF